MDGDWKWHKLWQEAIRGVKLKQPKLPKTHDQWAMLPEEVQQAELILCVPLSPTWVVVCTAMC